VNPSTARQTVIVSMLVTGAIVGYDVVRSGGAQQGDPSAFKTVWALGVLFLLLSITADLVPELAGPLAGLIMLAVLVGRGDAVKQIAQVIPSAGGKTQ
jgi:hypothetical protein